MGHASINRIYRLIWSQVQQTWIVVSECTKGKGKVANRALLTAVLMAAGPAAWAGPTGGQVTAGSGTISQSGSTTTVTQSSQNLSLNWQSFNTSAQEVVNFVQPSASSIAVNRISDANPTRFFGQLNANGQVYLVNPNGLLFGAGAQINVGALVASTLDTSDAALAGATRNFSGGGTGSIVNQGSINTSQGGYVAFIGNSVSNQGSIQAPGGAVALGAGSDVTLSFSSDSLVRLQVNQSTLNNLADNGGLIQAAGGAVWLSAGAKNAALASVVNNTGIIEARSVQNVNGTIVLEAGPAGTATNSGTLAAAGASAGEAGGTVKVLGGHVKLAAGSAIDVSGDAGGGTAYVGGNFLGQGPEQNAKTSTVEAGASIKADATTAGHGGKVAVWSDGTTKFDGSITARGGSVSGNGGQVETSGHVLKVGTSATVKTSAAHGTAGNWLLDPDNIVIGSVSMLGASYGIDVDSATLSNALNNGNVTIKTGATGPGNGDIIVLDYIGFASVYDSGHNQSIVEWNSNSYTLTLSAYRDIKFGYIPSYYSQGAGTTINVAGGVYSTGGHGNVTLRADNTATGTGRVIFDDSVNNFILLADSASTISIYYSSPSGTPTYYGGNILNGQLTAYMAINVTGTAASKVYDGRLTADVSGLTPLLPLPSGLTLNTSSAQALFKDKNVGTNKEVTITGVTATGSGATNTTNSDGMSVVSYGGENYYFNGLDSKTASITPKTIGVSGISANDKTYDGSTAAMLSGGTLSGLESGDIVSLLGGAGAFADANAGNGKAVTVSGYVLAGSDRGNYVLVQPTGVTATINKANLFLSGSKVYDGTAIVAGSTLTATGANDETFTVTGSGDISNLSSKNVQTNAALGSVTGLSLGSSSNGGLSSNYNALGTAGSRYTVTPKSLTLSGITAANKVYDATTAATLNSSGVTYAGLISGDTVALSGTGVGTFSTKDVGNNKAVTVSGYTLSGSDAGNYVVTQPTGVTANITKADLVVAGVSAADRTYNATTAATLSGTATVTALGGDVVSVAGTGTGSFADANAGTGKTVTVTGYSLTGSDAANYNVVQPTNVTATINKADLVLSGTRVYDGTTTVAGSTLTATGVAGQTFTVTGTGDASNLSSKDVQAGSVLASATGLALGTSSNGGLSSNYNVLGTTGSSYAVTARSITLSGITAADKVYDATTSATLDTSGVSYSGLILGDSVTLSGSGVGTFATKDVGTNKTVTVSGYVLSGSDAGNYVVTQPTGLTANITKADLVVYGVSAADKTYNATTAATLSGTASVTALYADVVGVTGTGVGSFADANAGNGKAVTVSGYTLMGTDAGNYNVVQPTGLTATINKADLVLSGTRVYDGSTSVAGSTLTATGVAGQTFTVTGTGDASNLSSKDVQAGSTLASATGLALGSSSNGGLSSNYNALGTTGSSYSVTPKSITLAGLTAADKVYDGTTSATLSTTGLSFSGLVLGDTLTLSGTGVGTFGDKNAGASKAVTVSGYTLGGSDAGNYVISQPSGLTASIAKADLVLSGVSAADKTYDATTTTTLTGTATVTGLLGSDVVSVAGLGSASFADANAGVGKAVTVSGVILTGSDAGNYNAVLSAGVTATIHKADLTLSGSKVYDGSTSVAGSTLTATGVNGETFSVTGSGDASNLSSKNVQANSALASAAGLALGSSSNGGLGSNYNALGTTGSSYTVTAKGLTLAGITAADKVYDGTVNATLNTTGVSYSGLVAGDAVALSGTGVGSFATKDAGTNKAVTVSGYTLSGSDAGNYVVTQPSGLTANIAKADLVVSGVSVADKTYDATTTATLSGAASLSGVIGRDAVTLGGAVTAAFADKHVGTDKSVVLSGYTLNGADAHNYNVVASSGLRANITPATITLSGITASDKVYDATTMATLDTTHLAYAGLIAGDQVTLGGSGVGSFATKDAGTNKAVTVSGYTLSGSDAGNYVVTQPSGLTANIARADLVVSGVSVANKTYDATTAATLTGTASVSALLNDAVSVTGTGSGSFADKNVGTNKAVTVSGYALSGADAHNYNVVAPSGLRANITPATITVSGITAADKVYDGTTAASVSTGNAVLAGRLGSDVVTITATGAFSDAAVGTGKTVALDSSYGGADAGNYTFAGQATALANISAAPAAGPTSPEQQVLNAVTQVQSLVLPPQASAQPQVLDLPSTLVVQRADAGSSSSGSTQRTTSAPLLNTSSGFGTPAPLLQIQNGGMKLPLVATSIAE